YSNNFDVFLDTDENIWVLASNGIYIANRLELLADPDPLEYTHLDIECGLPCVATANSWSDLTADGTLFIAGTTGVAYVNINEIGRDDKDITLTVPFIEMDGKQVYLAETDTDGNGKKTVVIPPGVRRITIYGYALTYSYQNPKVSYYLEGFDTEAFTLSRMNMQPVTYTNLNPGTYTFHLLLVNAMTGETEKTIAVDIVKEQAFYESLWFKIFLVVLFAILAILLVYLYFRRKTQLLEKEQKRTQKILDETIQAFAQCIDMKDTITNGHSFRVAKYTALLAKRMGYSDKEVQDFYNIGLLHDIGKISIPDEILFKPGKLTDEEYAVMKSHTSRGKEVLDHITIMKDLSIGAGYHHERIDGKGYPEGKSGDEIPKVAQIVAVADTYDTMHSKRPYKVPKTLEEITAELKRVSGTQLAEDVVKIMLSLIEEGIITDDEETSNAALRKIEGINISE
ncbi:MAG: HD domain-containing protein, partial [Lachnospiraceae bacterium]|nr:HD domain-containing protein [Lachnospiraceae bacterium]